MPNPVELTHLCEALRHSLADRLVAIVLYGPAATGEESRAFPEHNVLVVTRDLALETLAALGPPIDRWTRKGMPFPRLVTPGSLADAADVFPIELAELAEHHVVLHGALPTLPPIDPEHVRLQCERELREKMMRLQEGYALASGTPRALRELLIASYPTFATLFRACLRRVHEPLPHSLGDCVAKFCQRAEIDPAPFAEVEQLRRGAHAGNEMASLFARYYTAIEQAIARSNIP